MLLIPTLLCPKSWEKMSGDDRERFCTHCRQSVHNLDTFSVSERLALLASPAAKLCTRYKIAIRRAAKGRRESYARHLLKHGAAVAVAGGALLTLWETSAEGNQARRYRIYTESRGCVFPLSSTDYEEVETYILGAISVLPAEKPTPPDCDLPAAPTHIDVQIDPVQIDQLFNRAKPTPPAIESNLPAKLRLQ